MKTRRAVVGVILGLLMAACEDHNTNSISGPFSPVAPTPTPRADLIEFRVTGQLPFPVQVRINNSLNGLIQTTAVLPFAHALTVPTGRDNVFVSLNAQGTGVGFLHAAIFVNGYLFREASSDRNNPAVSITGTYRRQ